MFSKNFLIVAVFVLAAIIFVSSIVTGDVEILDSTIHLLLFGYILIAWRDIAKIQDRLTSIESQPRVDSDALAKGIASKIRELLRSN